ncbi:MAG: bifunctional sugar-1-phosphate nucleotidylyltransferase/acetyltransferase [Candidatus Kariarchaeaceae archaeon]|jgi:bifunctional UDP-N-acetylglucosamine pyrophosphorylase/glucosamine-1-phosphate N-acetyltransferase
MLFEYPIMKNIVSKDININYIVKAILLAAGRGTRLLPLTTYRPKHLLEVAGKSILKRLIDILLEIDTIEEIILVVHYYAEAITERIQGWYDRSEQKKIKIVIQNEPIGTGDAVKSAITKADVQNDFLVIYGDLIVGDSIKKIVNGYNKNPKRGYILGTKVDNPEKYGVLQIINGRLTSILEKPQNPPENSLINAGIFVFPKVAINLISKIKRSKRNEIELTDLIQLIINQGTEIEVIESEANWFDIGYPWELINANSILLSEEIQSSTREVEIEENVVLKGNVHISRGARIRSGSYIEGPVYIDEDADIGPNCYIRSATYIGRDVRIGNACEIKNSIIYSNTHTAHLSYIGDSVIGEGCNLGAGTITANLRHDKKNIKVTVQEKRVDSTRRKLGAIIGDNVKTGISVSLLPGIKIDADVWINAGDIVSRDVKKS